MRRFDIRLENPDKQWKTVNAWFHKQSEMNVVLTRRKPLNVSEKN